MLLRTAIGNPSNLHRATGSPAPRTQFGQEQAVATDRFRAGLLTLYSRRDKGLWHPAGTASAWIDVREINMTVEEFSKVAAVFVWPAVTLLLVWVFYAPVQKLLVRLAESLTFKSVKVKALGIEVELTPEAARTVLHELLDDITASTNELSPEAITLFDAIYRANGKKSLSEIIPGFVRDDKDGKHERLRNLRDQKLVVPRDGGPWKAEKVPVVTRYGLLVAKLRTTSASNVAAFASE